MKFKFESFKAHGLDQLDRELAIFTKIFNSGMGIELFTKLVERYNGVWEPWPIISWNGIDLDLTGLFNHLSHNVS